MSYQENLRKEPEDEVSPKEAFTPSGNEIDSAEKHPDPANIDTRTGMDKSKGGRALHIVF